MSSSTPVDPKPAYRRIWMRLFAEAAARDSGEVAAVLRDALSRYGEVDVQQGGPYWKIPTHLEFNVELTPHDRVDQCLATVRALAPHGWHEDVWNRPAAGRLLDPRVTWVWIRGQEASSPPRFRDGEIVVVRDCQAARAEGLVDVRAVVGGSSAPDPHDGSPQWSYVVIPEGREEVTCFDEPDLQPTGEHQPPDDGAPTWISVSVNGEITGHSG
jgi:hypothetical protein